MDKSKILDSAESDKALDAEGIKRAVNTFNAMHEIIVDEADKVEIQDCDIDEYINQLWKEAKQKAKEIIKHG
jgi:hypothetical protein